MPVSLRLRRLRPATLLAGAVLLTAFASPALALQLSREQDITGLRLGQKVLVDDGSCPNGQIKEVTGATLTASGVTRTRKCIPRTTR